GMASENVVYADASGAVGWQLMGQAPVRRQGHGALPMPGWDPDAGWAPGPVPVADMPHLLNPECGFVATANNRPVPEGRGPFLGVDFIDGYRQGAIVRALSARHDWDVASTQALQMSQQAPAWDELRDAVLAAPAADADARQAL